MFAVKPSRTGWWVGLDDGSGVAADAVVVTCPLPQASAVLISSGLGLPDGLRGADYDRTLALLAVLDRPSGVAPPGGVQLSEGVFSFVADNQQKGISAVPALTLHATAEWSAAHWDNDRDGTESALLDAALRWVGGATVITSQVKRWRFATPRTTWPEPCLVLGDPGSILFAGDAFAGPRVEGAALSGLAAGRALLA